MKRSRFHWPGGEGGERAGEGRGEGRRGGWFVQLYNLRTRILIMLIAVLLVIGAAAVVLGAWVTHRLKQHMVAEAQALAREECDKFCRRLEDIARREGAKSLSALTQHPEVQTQIRLLVRSGGTIRMAALLSADGKVILQQNQDQEASERLLRPQESVSGALEGGGDTTYEVRVEQAHPSISASLSKTLPIQEGLTQTPMGYLRWDLTDVSASTQLQRLSTAINESLVWMVGLVLAILAATLALLFKVFNRHLALERDKEAHARMASIGRMASGIAHEIRNPLQIINTNLDLIREEFEEARPPEALKAKTPPARAASLAPPASPASPVSPPAASPSPASAPNTHSIKILNRVQAQISQMDAILGDFMKFAIPSRLEHEPVLLRPLIGEVLDFIAPELEKNGAEAENRIALDAQIPGDSSSLRQVFLNIILNAIQAMAESPEKRLAVSSTRRAGAWMLEFEDTGCGIPPGKEEEIFEAMVSFRAGGTGFGLAIARRIIEDHGGRIFAQSPASKRPSDSQALSPHPKHPRQSPPPQPPAHPPHESSPPSPGARIVILLPTQVEAPPA